METCSTVETIRLIRTVGSYRLAERTLQVDEELNHWSVAGLCLAQSRRTHNVLAVISLQRIGTCTISAPTHKQRTHRSAQLQEGFLSMTTVYTCAKPINSAYWKWASCHWSYTHIAS